MKRIAIFASGAGTNAEQIILYFAGHGQIETALVVCNKEGAGVLSVAARHQVPTLMLEKEKFFRGNHYVDELRERKIDFIVLAGFLWKIPAGLIEAFRHRIVNIHPALLPKYGGKGMYGDAVHEEVVRRGEKISGISIHYVDEHYDHGDIIFQATCSIDEGETAASLAKKIHQLEHAVYPGVIEKLLGP